MSTAEQGLAQEIERIKDAVTESYDAIHDVESSIAKVYETIAAMGGTVPEDKTIENLNQAITTVSGTGSGTGSDDVWWSPRMTSNTTSTASLCGDDGAINSEYAWWTPKMLSNTTSVKPSLAHPELQEKSVAPATIAQTVTPDADYDGLSKVTVAAASLQEKTVTPSESSQVITPDSSYYGLSKVTTDPIPSVYKDTSDATATAGDIIAGKTAYVGSGKVTGTAVMTAAPTLQAKTVSPSTSQQIITPDSGYDGLSRVTVSAATKQSKVITPDGTNQIITPDSGYYGLSQVTVNKIPANFVSIPDYNRVDLTIKIGANYYTGRSDGGYIDVHGRYIYYGSNGYTTSIITKHMDPDDGKPTADNPRIIQIDDVIDSAGLIISFAYYGGRFGAISCEPSTDSYLRLYAPGDGLINQTLISGKTYTPTADGPITIVPVNRTASTSATKVSAVLRIGTVN